MANPKVEVEIVGNVKALQGAVATSEKIINGISESSNKASTNVQKLARSTSNYNSVGIDFARIIQDAPFGIIGVGNNIQQLAGSFQQLRATSGSTGAALKNALTSIFSPANALVLGISVLTTALTVLQMKGFFKTKESAEDSAESLRKYRESLDAVTRSSIEGEASVQREANSFQLLRAQAENSNVPLNKRIEAVNELQKQYPDYLGNLTKEQILTGNVGTSYEDLTKQLIATAKARAASDQIAKNSLKILTLEQQAQERVLTILEKREKLTRLEALATNQAAKSRGEFTGLDLQILQLRSEIANLSKDQLETINQINDVNKDNLALESQITKQVAEGALFTKSTVADLQKIKSLRKEISGITAPARVLPGSTDLPTLPSVPGVDTTPLVNQFKQTLDQVSEEFKSFSNDFLGSVQDLALNINNTIRGGLFNAFANLGNDLGQALATGANVVETIGRSLLNSMGAFLGDLGQQLVAFGVAGFAFTKLIETIKSGSPASIPAAIGAIAAGTAMIAIGSAFRAKAGAGLSGGIGGGRSVSGVGVGGQTFGGSGLESSFINGLEVTGLIEVDGTKLLIALENATKKRNRG